MGLVIKGKIPRIKALDAVEQELANVLARLMRNTGKAVDWDAIAVAITNRDADAINRMVTGLKFAATGVWSDLENLLHDVLSQSGAAEASAIRNVIASTFSWGTDNTITGHKPDTPFRFDQTEPNAMRWAQMRAAQLVTSIDQSTEESIKRIIFESFKDQITGVDTATRLRNIIGLHPRWALAVNRFATTEYNRLRNAGIPHAQALVQSQAATERYRLKLIRARATMIARTEIMTASNMGRQMSWSQGANQGYVDPTSMKRWSTSATLAGLKDAKRGVCDRCRPMRNEMVRIDQPFSNGLMMPPAHPHCRCTAALVPPSRGLTGLPSQNLDAVVAELGSTSADVAS
jgi:hypothetical protein